MTKKPSQAATRSTMWMRVSITPSFAIPPCLNRQNSHTSHSISNLRDATSILTRVASTSSRTTTPKSSAPSSPAQTSASETDFRWDQAARRLSDCSQGTRACAISHDPEVRLMWSTEGYISFPDFDRFESGKEAHGERMHSRDRSIDS